MTVLAFGSWDWDSGIWGSSRRWEGDRKRVEGWEGERAREHLAEREREKDKE